MAIRHLTNGAAEKRGGCCISEGQLLADASTAQRPAGRMRRVPACSPGCAIPAHRTAPRSPRPLVTGQPQRKGSSDETQTYLGACHWARGCHCLRRSGDGDSTRWSDQPLVVAGHWRLPERNRCDGQDRCRPWCRQGLLEDEDLGNRGQTSTSSRTSLRRAGPSAGTATRTELVIVKSGTLSVYHVRLQHPGRLRSRVTAGIHLRRPGP